MEERKVIKLEMEIPVTEQDIKLAQMIADGNTGKQIAEKTGINQRTVEAQLATLKKKYRVKSPVGIVMLFYRNDLIS